MICCQWLGNKRLELILLMCPSTGTACGWEDATARCEEMEWNREVLFSTVHNLVQHLRFYYSIQQKKSEKTRYWKCNIIRLCSKQQLRVHEQPQWWNHINAISSIWSCITTTTTNILGLFCPSISWNYGIKFEMFDVCTVLWDKLSIKVAKCAWYLRDIALSRSLLLIEKSK